MGFKPRRSPERKAADKRLDRALTARRASKAERSQARALFGSLVSNERDKPMPFDQAHRTVMYDLNARRMIADRVELDRFRSHSDGAAET